MTDFRSRDQPRKPKKISTAYFSPRFHVQKTICRYLVQSSQSKSQWNTLKKTSLISLNMQQIINSSLQLTSFFTVFFQFDFESCFVFFGDDQGQVVILRIRAENHCQNVRSLNGHSGAITCLHWNPAHKILYSTGQDKNIICWDIGGQQGKVIELHAHADVPVKLYFSKNYLYSIGNTGKVICWDMSQNRVETPKWLESDSCQVKNVIKSGA